MNSFRRLSSVLVLPLALALVVISFPMVEARAGLVTTERVIEQRELDAKRTKVAEFLSREAVRDQMQAMGLPADEAAARVASLSDAEVTEIAGRIDAIPAGQQSTTTAIIIILLVVVILILLI